MITRKVGCKFVDESERPHLCRMQCASVFVLRTKGLVKLTLSVKCHDHKAKLFLQQLVTHIAGLTFTK